MVVSIESSRESVNPIPSAAERRREPRVPVDRALGSAMILGDEKSRTICRVLDTSSSGMRISVGQPFAKGVQVHVEWDGKFFVGTTCYRVMKGSDYHLGLDLVTCSYGQMPGRFSFALGRLWRFLWQRQH